jgi:hypothetical protein
MGPDETHMEKQEGPKRNDEVSFGERFGWFSVINKLSEDDITRHDKVLEKTLVEALNQLVYIVAKEKEIQKQHREMMAQHRI